MKVRKTVYCGLFSALIFAATFVLKFPVVGAGYVNLGDVIIILSGIVLGPYYGMISSCIGATVGDFVSGYAVYAPMTLVIKGLMGLTVGFIAENLFDKKSFFMGIIGGIVSEIIMIAGYFFAEWIFFGIIIAAADLISNIIQGAVCVAASAVGIILLLKNGFVREFFRKI